MRRTLTAHHKAPRSRRLSDLFARIDEWWGEQGVPRSLAEEIDRLFQDDLPEVLDAGSPADAARLASMLADRVDPLLLPPSDW